MYTELQLNKIIGENIKYYRELYNVGKSRQERITQERLSELAEVSTSLIGNMESEKTRQGISLYTLYKISSILSVSIDKFFIPIGSQKRRLLASALAWRSSLLSSFGYDPLLCKCGHIMTIFEICLKGSPLIEFYRKISDSS